MKEDLRRLMDEFLKETRSQRQEKRDLQFTEKMPAKYEYITRKPTLQDFIYWLNEDKD